MPFDAQSPGASLPPLDIKNSFTGIPNSFLISNGNDDEDEVNSTTSQYTVGGFTKTGPTKTGITVAQVGGSGSYVLGNGSRPQPDPQHIGANAFGGSFDYGDSDGNTNSVTASGRFNHTFVPPTTLSPIFGSSDFPSSKVKPVYETGVDDISTTPLSINNIVTSFTAPGIPNVNQDSVVIRFPSEQGNTSPPHLGTGGFTTNVPDSEDHTDLYLGEGVSFNYGNDYTSTVQDATTTSGVVKNKQRLKFRRPTSNFATGVSYV